MSIAWSSPKAIREALKKTRTPSEKFFEGLSAFNDSHHKALRGLTDEELAKLAKGPKGVSVMAWMIEGAHRDFPEVAARLAVALAKPANTALLRSRHGWVMAMAVKDAQVPPEAVRQVIDTVVPLGAKDPQVYTEAAFCAAALGSWAEAIELLAKAKKGKDRSYKSAKKAPVFKPLAKDARFLALFGAKAPKPAKPVTLKPVKMSNSRAVAAFRACRLPMADVTFEAKPAVDFWFAGGSKRPNDVFRCFATTGDGSLVAEWNADGQGFDAAPVVFLGSEGHLAVLGANVPEALALFARCGDDGLDGAVEYDVEPFEESDATAWAAKTFGLRITEQPRKRVATVGKTNGWLKKLTAVAESFRS